MTGQDAGDLDRAGPGSLARSRRARQVRGPEGVHAAAARLPRGDPVLRGGTGGARDWVTSGSRPPLCYPWLTCSVSRWPSS